MKNNKITSAIIDNILRFLAAGGSLSAVMVTPNIATVLDKSLWSYLNKLDKRAHEREWRRILYNMRKQGLISYTTEDYYEHGIKITARGRYRALKTETKYLKIPRPVKWDRHWRMVLFDIPENRKVGRDALIARLRDLGFRQLQRSAWVHPFPCREEIELLTLNHDLNKFVSYIEIKELDNQRELIKRFKHLRLK